MIEIGIVLAAWAWFLFAANCSGPQPEHCAIYQLRADPSKCFMVIHGQEPKPVSCESKCP